ncbi:MAG: hypothetical protein KDN19_03075 [Verrucomicrobiae bacterium]|nr:hypothetical protein [Verrucomicrobiae bacterium]
MKTSLVRSLPLLFLAAALSSFCLAPNIAVAQLPAVRQFLGDRPGLEFATDFGATVALSDRWIVIGDTEADLPLKDAGSVHVFDARSGRLRHKLSASQPQTDAEFGRAISIRGHLVLIGAPGENSNSGAAYLFDLRTGQELLRLTATVQSPGLRFGQSLALSDDRIAIGCPFEAFGAGRIYLFDPNSGAYFGKLKAEDAASGDQFGTSVTIDGDLILCGSPFANTAVADSGAAYLFHAVSRQQIQKFAPADVGSANAQFGSAVAIGDARFAISAPDRNNSRGAVFLYQFPSLLLETMTVSPTESANERFGAALALDGNLLLVGAPTASNSTGRVFAYRPDRGEFLYSLPRTVSGVGNSVALCGDRAVTGAPDDDTQLRGNGAAYLYSQLSQPLPLQGGPVIGDFTPGIPGGQFRRFQKVAITPYGEAAFLSIHPDPAVANVRGQALWASSPDRNSPRSYLERGFDLDAIGEEFAGKRVATILDYRFLAGIGSANLVRISGDDVTPRNATALIYHDNSVAPVALVRTGTPIPDLGDSEIARIHEFVDSGALTYPIAYSLRRGVAGRDRTNDSGVISPGYDYIDTFFNHFKVRERAFSPSGGIYGQFAPRIAVGNAREIAYAAFRIDDEPLPAIYNSKTGKVAEKNEAVGDFLPGVTFRAFLGETYSSTQPEILFRAILQGPGITGANNEAIFHQDPAIGLVARKGDQHPTEPNGQVWNRFLGFWPSGSDAVMILATLRGPGVTAQNDRGLWLLQSDGSWLRLLREGDTLPGPAESRVTTIRRVSAEGIFGNYAVLCQLSGPRGANLALITGRTLAGDPDDLAPLRRPRVVLRKGTLADPAESPGSRVRSIAMESPLDRAGAGAKGGNESISRNGEIAAQVIYERGIREIRFGKW